MGEGCPALPEPLLRCFFGGQGYRHTWKINNAGPSLVGDQGQVTYIKCSEADLRHQRRIRYGGFVITEWARAAV